MLRVTQSNRLEELAIAISDALPVGDAFARPTIVVASRLVGRWLQYDLARRRGIAAGLELPFLEPFVERAFTGDDAAREVGLRGLDRLHLGALLASALADRALVDEPAMAPVRGYLSGPEADVRRVQLAQRVALLLWDYALTRPDWLDAWDGGKEADVGDVDRATLAWQRRLYEAILPHGIGRYAGAQWALVPRLVHARRRLGLPTPIVRAPVHVAGFSYLARAHLDALGTLAQHQEVHVAMVTPCAEYWEDVAGRKRARVSGDGDDPLALQLWGTAGRDTAGMLLSAVEGDVTERHVDPAPGTALGGWARDVLHREKSAAPATEAGVTVLACPSLARELEIVGSEIWRLLRADPTLRASDIAVLVAGDADRYVAQVGPVFGSLHKLPFHLVDAPAASSGRVAEAALQLLELPLGRFTRREMLALMTHPAVLARHSQAHVDPADWARWCERLGIAHGADDRDHAKTYLEGMGAFHWAQGVERLAIGAFVAGPRAGADEPVDVGRSRGPVLPEELMPDQEASAATFALLARSLTADARWLVERSEPLTRWAQILPALVEAYLADVGETEASGLGAARGALAQVSETLVGLADLDLDGRQVPYREVVELARTRLGGLREGRGEPLAHGVRVAPLEPMRPLPAAVTFVVGLGEGEFPAGDHPSPLDLRSTRRRGDVAPRDRDRYAFLEAVLATRGPLYLSYVARNEQSGDRRAPSSVIHELAEMLAPYLGVATAAEALARLTVEHPLRRWDDRYDPGSGSDPRLTPSASPAAIRERHAIAVRRSLDTHLAALGRAAPDAPRLRELLAAPTLVGLRAALRLDLADGIPPVLDDAETPVVISLATLRRFLDSPVQAWAQLVLRLDSPGDDDDGSEREDEPFDDDARERAAAMREAFALVLGGTPIADAYGKIRRRRELAGQAPLGPFGAAARRRDLDRLEAWRKELDAHGALTGPWTRIAFGRAGDSFKRASLRPALALELEIRGRRRIIEIVGTTELLGGAAHERSVVLVNKEPTDEHRLRNALDHLVLSAAGVVTGARDSHVLGQALEKRRLMPWTRDEALGHLAVLVGDLLGSHHAYFLPYLTLKTSLKGGTPKRPSLSSEVPPLGYGPLDRDPGLAIPDNAAEIAMRRLVPISSRIDDGKS